MPDRESATFSVKRRGLNVDECLDVFSPEYITEISWHVALSNQSHSLHLKPQWGPWGLRRE